MICYFILKAMKPAKMARKKISLYSVAFGKTNHMLESWIEIHAVWWDMEVLKTRISRKVLGVP